MQFETMLRAHLEQVDAGKKPDFADLASSFYRTVSTYALESRLVRRGAAETAPVVTPLGATFLRLRGRDAVRWLLTVECEQSTGMGDPWRVSRALLREAKAGIQTHTIAGDLGLYPRQTLDRLRDLDVLRVEVNSRYVVSEAMREIVDGVIEPGAWQTAIRATLEDEAASAIFGAGPRVAEATIEQSRMIAHEVRNALVPVRHHVDALLNSGTDPQRTRMQAVRRGVVRVLEFVEQMVETVDLVTELEVVCDLIELAREAAERCDGFDRLVIDNPTTPVRVKTVRSELVLVLSNVIRNAFQATDSTQLVRIHASRVDRAVRIEVDDGGPGVPEADRSRIFDDGFSTRSGGSGLGLALVRRIVETKLRGKVWCEASDLGGARFVITFPAEPAP